MSSYAYMKVLESTPERYDRGIRLLSHGAVDRVYERIGELAAAPGRRLLDLGCGTGNLALVCAARGARVVGIDRDAGMLEVAQRKVEGNAAAGRIELYELGALELEDRFEEDSFDGAVSCLLVSELTPEERAYVLGTLRSLVRAGGLVVIADEAAPEGTAARAWWRLGRAPLVAWTWLLTQTSTSPLESVGKLEEALADAGLVELASERLAGNFVLASGRVPAQTTER